MRIRVLGAVRAEARGTALLLGGPKHRAVLRYLALRANSVVSIEDLLAALWRDEPPRTGRKMIQNTVSELRGVLAQDDDPSGGAVLLTHSPGYLLRIDPDRVDAGRFARHAEDGLCLLRDGDRRQGLDRLRSALAVWPPETPQPAPGSLEAEWAEWRDLLRLRRAVEERIVEESEAGGALAARPEPDRPPREVIRPDGGLGTSSVLLVTAESPATPGESPAETTHREAWAAARVHAHLRAAGGRVHVEFGSLVIAVLPAPPAEARAVAGRIRADLIGREGGRARTVSAVVLPAGPAEEPVPAALVDEGVRLLSERERGVEAAPAELPPEVRAWHC
ncbi:AfsR/SARP family transcriptional regulator [Actinoalloteichus caeruleus]|uniref:AfsR/SARP family transcriptional regulator n=1 Tax=Actinoalloteichus cyanogriseus TaxID=2893586 RepID=UPI0004AB9392|nr:winged helix-turn-helix domain-containing protein [Actinoalloteichus caeruleus]